MCPLSHPRGCRGPPSRGLTVSVMVRSTNVPVDNDSSYPSTVLLVVFRRVCCSFVLTTGVNLTRKLVESLDTEEVRMGVSLGRFLSPPPLESVPETTGTYFPYEIFRSKT